jgi:hypothetical protein
MGIKSGNSNFQQEVEKEMLLLYAKEHKLVFDKASPTLKGCAVQVDGYSKNELTACEVFAHVGKLKSGQVHKIAQDVLKLIYLDKKLNKKHKKVLLFADDEACKPFAKAGNAKWLADCLREFGIETWVVPLPEKTKVQLLEWQEKQGRKFRKK